MIPHIHTLFEFLSTPYENQHQTLNIESVESRYYNQMYVDVNKHSDALYFKDTHKAKSTVTE